MSQWTHVRGSVEFNASPYELKGKKNPRFGSKDVYLPYPEKQLILSAPEPYYYTSETETDTGIEFDVRVCSLPKAEKYIKEAMKKLPQGESGWSYNLYQNPLDYSTSSSDFDYPCEEKEFERQVTELYNKSKGYEDTWKEYKDWFNIRLRSIDYSTGIILGVREDLRHCSGEELLTALENFFNELRAHDISVEDGYLEWEDEWNQDIIYAWRSSRIDSDINRLYRFMKLDAKTNKVIWSKEYRYALTKDGEPDYDNVISVEETFGDNK